MRIGASFGASSLALGFDISRLRPDAPSATFSDATSQGFLVFFCCGHDAVGELTFSFSGCVLFFELGFPVALPTLTLLLFELRFQLQNFRSAVHVGIVEDFERPLVCGLLFEIHPVVQ